MKRRAEKKTNPKPKTEDNQEKEFVEEDSQEKPTRSKSKKSTNNNQPKPKKATKTKSKDIEESNNESNQQNIIQFRHGDDVSKDHIIPPFILRWDGISNELQIYPQQIADLTPMLQAYWRVKEHHMNTIVLVEVGRGFMVLENDALRMHDIFKKKLFKFSKFLMVSFWGRETEMAKKQLFDMNIPILVMTEVQDPQFIAQFGMVRREITQVLTPALHFGYHDERPRSRLMMALQHRGSSFAVVILDSQSNHFFVEQSKDDAHFHELRRVMNKYRPVELLLPAGQRSLLQLAKQICNPYFNEIQSKQSSIGDLLQKFIMANPSSLFRELQESYNAQRQDFSGKDMVIALGMLWQHLDSFGLLEKIFFQGIFHSLGESMNQSCCTFDSQVYQNLQIFNVKTGQDETYRGAGSLIGFLDRCRTQHGRKLLHRWIDQPLLSIPRIIERQQAVKQLLQTPQLLVLHEKLDAYERLQKRMTDIYHWVSKNSEHGKLVLTGSINYEKDYDLRKNPAVIRLTEIMQVLKLLKEYESFLKQISRFQLESPLLKRLIELVDVEMVHDYTVQQISSLQCLPIISYVVDLITRRVSYDEITGNLQPMQGQNEIYDYQKANVQRINAELQAELSKWKQYFKTQKITYVSVRARNQIQIPKTAISKSSPHRDLIFSSEVSNGIRYVTHESSQLSQELMQHQKVIAEAYEPFLQTIITHFCSYKYLWDRYIQAMGTLDVLMSMAKAAKSMQYRCMPIFKDEGTIIHKAFHPGLLTVKEGLVPNSLTLQSTQKALLLTGPNMGGKSTLLKQVCLLAILAQIGSFVPAEYYQSSLYDQIFCRMGASDRILEGKSTFYVELQETKRILEKATENSLVVIDELGRGTSTFDGMAIAEAVLLCLIDKVKCCTLFSTHYTQITEQFRNNDAVRMMKMSFQEREGNVEFSYQLVDGVAERSFACNVARMVGIPSIILTRAEARSQKMHSEIHKKKLIRQVCRMIGHFKQSC